MSQKTLNLCLERYNFVKFGETTKSSHTVLCINNANNVNSAKYRLTPTAIASKHGEGYVFTLNYDFDRPLFTIVQKSYTLDGTSGNIVFEGIDPISKGGSKYLRKVTVSPVELSDGSYLLEVTNDEYLRIGTTGAALGDEDLGSLNEKIVTAGGISKSVETVGGKQVLKLDAGGPSGSKEIFYFDIDPSDPPSGIYDNITVALSNDKEPVIRIDGAVYFYTAAGTDKYVFVGGYTKDAVGYTEIEVSDDDSVTSKSVDDKVFNMFLLYKTDPASPGDPPGDEDSWVCDANKHVITKDELVAAHADCRYFILNNDVDPDSNSRKYFAAVTNVSNSYVQLRFYMVEYSGEGAANFYQKTVSNDSEGRLYISDSYQTYLAGTSQAVLVSEPQSFNATQKAQGRDNIGAASASDVAALQSQVSSLSDVSAYSVKGEATVAQLNAGPSGIQAGWAYQLTDSGTLTDGSLAVVAGDTVAWDGTKWFPLVRSDYYATKTYVQNVAHSIAPEYNGTTGAVAGKSYMYQGKRYICKENTSGDWDGTKFEPDASGSLSVQNNQGLDIGMLKKMVSRVADFSEDLNAWTFSGNGYMFSSNGTTYDTCKTQVSGWGYYEKNVSEGEVYRIYSYAGQFARLWFMFDASGNKVAQNADSSAAGQKTDTIIIPKGVVKVVVSRGKLTSSPVSDISIGIEKIDLIDETLSAFDENTDNVAIFRNNVPRVKNSTLTKELGLASSMLGDMTSWAKGDSDYFISNSGTTYDTCKLAGSGWTYYYKSVNPGEVYSLSSWCGQSARLWLMFDANGNKVAANADSSPSQKEDVVTIPDNVTLIVVNKLTNYGTISIGKKIVTIPESHIRDKNPIILPADKLYGKTLVVCGDSITYGDAIGEGGTIDESSVQVFQRSGRAFVEKTSGFFKNYGFDIATRHNMIYYNDGINGSTMENIATKHPFSEENGRYTTLPDNLDYLVIWFGWNDTAYGTLGTISDNTNESYYGGYNVVIPYLQNKYPYAKICLVVPYGTDEGHRNAVRLLCNKYGLACFDMYKAGTPLFFGKETDVGVKASVVSANKRKFLSDGTHPNVYGHEQLADMLEAFLMTI